MVVALPAARPEHPVEIRVPMLLARNGRELCSSPLSEIGNVKGAVRRADEDAAELGQGMTYLTSLAHIGGRRPGTLWLAAVRGLYVISVRGARVRDGTGTAGAVGGCPGQTAAARHFLHLGSRRPVRRWGPDIRSRCLLLFWCVFFVQLWLRVVANVVK